MLIAKINNAKIKENQTNNYKVQGLHENKIIRHTWVIL